MRLPAIILITIAAIIAFEYWRLSNPETVRLRQTWSVDTREGPRTFSSVVELRQYGAIPYLPGGAVGQSEAVGRLPVEIDVSGKTFFVCGPSVFLFQAIQHGTAPPPLKSFTGSPGTTNFIRQVRRTKNPIIVDFTKWSAFDRNNVRIGGSVDAWGQLGAPIWRLPDFEAAHPGFRLRSVTYLVTEDRPDR